MLSTRNRLHRRFISLFSTHSTQPGAGTLHKLIIHFVGWWLLALTLFRSQHSTSSPFIVIAFKKYVFAVPHSLYEFVCVILVVYFSCFFLFNFKQTEHVEVKSVANESSVSRFDKAKDKELIFYHSLFPIIYSIDYYLVLLCDAFFMPLRIYIYIDR